MSAARFLEKLKNHELIVGLSPMDGVTDCAYREICKLHGQADILYTEFQNVHGMCLGAERIFEHFQYTENQRYIVAQIYGQEVEYYYPAALLCFILGFDGVDINMGCPAKKISDRGAGAGLIRFPDTAKKIIQEVKRARSDFQLFVGAPPVGALLNPQINPGHPQGVPLQEILYFLKSQTPYNPELNSWESLNIKWEKLLKICEELTEKWEVNSLLLPLNSSRGIPLGDSDNHLIGIAGAQLKSRPIVGEGAGGVALNLTVSVKTRIGYDTPILEKWILEILSQDIDFLCVHGRTLKQMYTGTADWEEIGKGIKTARANGYTTPIFANGDIKSLDDARKCLEITGADGLLVGRGTYGDPELLDQIKSLMSSAANSPLEGVEPLARSNCSGRGRLAGVDIPLVQKSTPPESSLVGTPQEGNLKTLTPEKINLILEHCTLFEKFKGPSQFFQMRKVLGWYISGIDNAVELRKQLFQTNSKLEVEKILQNYANTQSHIA